MLHAPHGTKAQTCSTSGFIASMNGIVVTVLLVGGAWVPLLRAPLSLDAFLQRTDPGARWVLDATGASAPILDPTSPACALVGPEGGLSDVERSAVLARGFIPVSVGRLTLRFETAAIAAAVLIHASRHR